MKVRDIIRALEEDGWYIVNQEGSHRQFKHPTKPGRATVAGHMGDDVPPGTLNNILRQAGLKKGRK
ncbi:MAG TPA: type II toxin-antitoxin system HicA family toxin [Spirochaetia bacterium]|nr:type II toxin-antitoxin system HicA family toxin [Spirochaetia bacterium]